MFSILSSSVHGQGWVATCDILADTSILDEECLFSIGMNQLGDEDILSRKLQALNSTDREDFLALYGKTPIDKLYMNGCPIVDIHTDPFGLAQRKKLGIFLKCARLNHSCRPNAARATGEDGVTSVVAQRNIRRGEEITISYLLDNLLSAKDRISQIASNIRPGDTETYKDGCLCSLCQSSPEEIMLSDERRRTLATYRARLLVGHLPPHEMGDLFELLQMEGMNFSLLGTEACLKLFEQTETLPRGLPQTLEGAYSATLTIGTRVRLCKLRAKPELNGQTGVIVTELNLKSGRVGVKLDQKRDSPVAVKPDNIITVREW